LEHVADSASTRWALCDARVRLIPVPHGCAVDG